MANVTVANTSANVSGKTLITAENSYTVSGLYTFSRSPSAPFAVAASSANVTNLDADLCDGEHGSAFHAAANITGTTLASNVVTSSLTTVGTIGTGTWNATKIGLLYGGTNADLSGTGGTSQFLKQASVGAAITVARPAIADLSDGSNVAVLNAQNIFSVDTLRGIILGTGAATSVASIRVNGGTNSGAGSAISFARGGTDKDYFGTQSFVLGGTGDGVAISSSADILLATNGGTVRWGINTAGDFVFGASSHIADSIGTPSISSGFSASNSTIAGTDYAFVVTVGASPTGSSAILNFGHTWSTTPICTANSDHSGTATQVWVSPSTTQVQVGNAGSIVPGATEHFFVLCRGY